MGPDLQPWVVQFAHLTILSADLPDTRADLWIYISPHLLSISKEFSQRSCGNIFNIFTPVSQSFCSQGEGGDLCMTSLPGWFHVPLGEGSLLRGLCHRRVSVYGGLCEREVSVAFCYGLLVWSSVTAYWFYGSEGRGTILLLKLFCQKTWSLSLWTGTETGCWVTRMWDGQKLKLLSHLDAQEYMKFLFIEIRIADHFSA